MSASVTSKKLCATCKKPAGIMTCDGCQQSFCGKHSSQHRQEIANKMEEIIQEYDLIHQEFRQATFEKNILLKEIDEWEKDAIIKIQAAAYTARRALQEVLEQSKDLLVKKSQEIAKSLRSSHESDDYSENELIQWKEQLKKLQSEISYPLGAKLIPDKNTPIYLITLKTNESSNDQSLPITTSSNVLLPEQFLQTLGPVTLEEGGYLAKHIGHKSNYAYIRGQQLYSAGRHTMQFRLERFNNPYRIFFGCMSSNVPLQADAFQSTNSVGWFGYNQTYEHGRCSSNCKQHGYYSSKIEPNDILHITFDCDKKQIQLFNLRRQATSILNVNLTRTPYPWQLLMVIFHRNDHVRMLTNI